MAERRYVNTIINDLNQVENSEAVDEGPAGGVSQAEDVEGAVANAETASSLEEIGTVQLAAVQEIINALPAALRSELTREVLKVTRTVFTNSIVSVATTENDAPCVICMEEFSVGQPLRYLRCGHYFHINCLNKWLANKLECPVCRNKLV